MKGLFGDADSELWESPNAWGVGAPVIGPIGITPSQEAIDDVSHADALIVSLRGDITRSVAVGGGDRWPELLLLQGEYAGFEARWINFRVAFDNRDFVAVVHAVPEVRNYLEEYKAFRDRYRSLGGLASQAPIDRPKSPIDEALSYLPWIAGAAVIWFLAPVIMPIVGGLIASRRSS